MSNFFEYAASFFAFVAAIFWFISAYGKLPKMSTYWDETPPDDPFYMAIKFSASMNRWAAGFSGLSALSIVASILTKQP